MRFDGVRPCEEQDHLDEEHADAADQRHDDPVLLRHLVLREAVADGADADRRHDHVRGHRERVLERRRDALLGPNRPRRDGLDHLVVGSPLGARL